MDVYGSRTGECVRQVFSISWSTLTRSPRAGVKQTNTLPVPTNSREMKHSLHHNGLQMILILLNVIRTHCLYPTHIDLGLNSDTFFFWQELPPNGLFLDGDSVVRLFFPAAAG